MRITIVISSLAGGGAERVCVNLANAWVEAGRAVTIVTVVQRGQPPAYTLDPRIARRDLGWPRGVEPGEWSEESMGAVLRGIYRAGCVELMTGQVALIALLREAILATAPDVVVSHIDATNIRVLAALHDSGIPVIACEHTDTTQVPLYRWQSVRETFYREAHAVVAPHPLIANWLARREARAVAIPNALVAPAFTSAAPKGERRRLVTLGRLAPEKRLDMLIRAFALVEEDFPDWDLELHGDGPLRGELATMGMELILRGRLRFGGFATDPYAVLRGADLFVSTSWVEGFGNAVWEALACGVPVLAMDAGEPLRALVRDGVDGRIIESHGVHNLSVGLAGLMGDDAARARFAARAPEVVQRYSMEASLAAWASLLDEVGGRREKAEGRMQKAEGRIKNSELRIKKKSSVPFVP